MNRTLLYLLALIISFSLQANELIISLSSSNKDYRATDDLLVRFELHNNSSQTIKVLKWHTPLESGFNADMFDIYTGKKRLSYSGTINLEQSYKFDNTGDYNIIYFVV